MKFILSLLVSILFLLSSTFAGECEKNLSTILNSHSHTSAFKKTFFGFKKSNQSYLKHRSLKALKYLTKLAEIEKKPNILMGATEFGSIKLGSENVVAKVGGLAVVVNDMMNNFLSYYKKIGKQAELSFGFMLYDGIPKKDLKLISYYMIDMDRGVKENVGVYKYVNSNGAIIYFFDHPSFKKMSIKGKGNVYQLKDNKVLYSGREEWEEAFIYGLYNKALGRLQRDIKANIYHAHDQHSSLASLHVDKDVVVSMTIHNGGPGYQGLYYTKGYGEFKPKEWSNQYNTFVPTGDYLANDHLLKMLGVTYEQYLKYYEFDNGRFLTMKGSLKFIEERNLIAGIPVSQGYKDELMTSQNQLIENIRNQKGRDVKNLDKLFIPNGGVDLGFLRGIENGLALNSHAKNNIFLAPKKIEDLNDLHKIISDNTVRHERGLKPLDPNFKNAWLKDLRFGSNLDNPLEVKKVHTHKAKLKEMLQITADLEVNPKRPLFTLVTRIVDQKNIDIFVENIKYIIKRGGQVVVGGLAGDDAGELITKKMLDLNNDQSLRGSFRFFDSFVNQEFGAMIFGGGDAFVITSKFEPCGLTDLEAIYMGNIPITRKVGGLGKVKNSITYNWSDSSDPDGEVLALRKALDEFIDIYNNDYDKIKKMRIEGLNEDFSWPKALSKYDETYQIAMLHKFYVQLDKEIDENNLTRDEIQKILKIVYKNNSVQLSNKYFELLHDSKYLFKNFEL